MQGKIPDGRCQKNGTLKICPNCGKEFVKDSVFCCNACYQEDRAKKKEYTKYLRDNGLKVCEECGKEFSGLGKFCSAECEVLHKDKEPHAYKNCVICHKTFFCPASEMMAPLCSDSCRQEYNRKQEQNKKKAKQIKMVSAAELKAKKKAAAEKKYIAENGLCSICRTSYKDCERMQSNYTASPKGAVFSGSLVIKCPKYTTKKLVHRPA